MTTSDSRDPTALSDPRVDAAWRALSGEDPPQHLDAAIMAAARREVGARPQGIGAREALADRRRWWPLAAAATVAAIAVGVLQLTNPDQLGAPAPEKTILTDMPAPAVLPVLQMPATASRLEDSKPEGGNTLRAEQTPARADSPRRPTPAPESRAPAKRESASAKTSAMAEPFPAAPPQPVVDTAAAPAVAGPIAAPAPAPQLAAAGPIAAPAPAPQLAAAGQIAAPAPPPQPVSAGQITAPAPATQPASAGLSQRARESDAARAAPLAKMDAGRAADAGVDEVRVKDRGPLPVAEWIALIRRLRDEGKTTDAAKELAAFRVAHADHDKLLPSDLRYWRSPEKD